MNAQKIADIRAQESLLQFLASLPTSFEAQLFYVVMVVGALGLFFHYAVKWMRKDIAGGLLQYLFHDNFRGTLLSVTLTVGAGVGAISTGMFEADSGEFIGWFKALVLAFGNGYFWDSVANKGTRAAWTEAQRAARTK